ncbi:SMP-30/gluconolactonase/LRE family protein [Stakelama tenebrarum]|uniref:SMP-30/Gluconolactonase/LRE-like region domain-containing protein n=1 Tax=Stakelama tenebrarum TaxID=2711215 RepID=A0A6G6Y6J1_9SPHN|nr:hypothetical protein [Sphingosinithalassobacter tenebrarum]QIG80519.1 hypothetical protein G5C33_12490 [Sphingosinithalassobacter tenebrarum]
MKLWLGLLVVALLSPAQSTGPRAVFTIDAGHRLIEGIAASPRGIYFSSIVDREVGLRGEDGSLRFWRLPDAYAAPFGIAYDAQRDWLWIAAQCPEKPRVSPCGDPALIAVDANFDVRRHLTVQGAFHPGDVSAGGGSVFVSDSGNGAVYRCGKDCTALEQLTGPRERGSAQGSTLDSDGSHLIYADYRAGIMRIDLATGEARAVATADERRLRGIDGLVRVGDRYVGVFNASVPGALISFAIDAEGRLADPGKVEDGGVIGDPTQLALRGEELLFIGDSQWSRFAGDDPVAADDPQPTTIFALPVDAVSGD